MTIAILPLGPAPVRAAACTRWLTHPASAFWQMGAPRRSTTCARTSPPSQPTRSRTRGSGSSTACRRSSSRRTTRRPCCSPGVPEVPGRRPRHAPAGRAAAGAPVHGLTVRRHARDRRVLLRRAAGARGSSSSPTCATSGSPRRTPRSGSACCASSTCPASAPRSRCARREDFCAALDRREPTMTELLTRPTLAPHLNPAAMAVAHRHLVTKALSEFAHERLLAPVAGRRGLPRDASADGRLPVPRPPAGARALGDRRGLADAHGRRGEPRRSTRSRSSSSCSRCCRSPTRCSRCTWRSCRRRSPAPRSRSHHGGPSATELPARRPPDRRARDDRGAPGVRRQQRPDRLRRSTSTPRTRPRPVPPIRPLWLGVRTAASHLALGSGLDEDAFYLDELGAADARPVRGGAARPRARTRPTTGTCPCTRGSGSTGSP